MAHHDTAPEATLEGESDRELAMRTAESDV